MTESSTSPRSIECYDCRVERDSLGTYPVPKQALYGIHTARAVANFPISGTTIGSFPELIAALAKIKKAACRINTEQGVLPADLALPITQACDEVASGEWKDQFVVDVFQGGAGTSTNMNVNEVIANRALLLLGKQLGDYKTVDPIGHVNRCQSTNDCYASAVRLAVYDLNGRLVGALARLAEALDEKADAFAMIEKLGRTQLQDAVPMTLGAEIGAFATTLREDLERFTQLPEMFLEINLGGTAIGSGIGAGSGYRDGIVKAVAAEFGLPVTAAKDLYEASWDMGDFVLYSGLLKRLAVKLSKIANDLRLLSSGPRGGLGELILPARQAGSSLMPGKVNPVIPEALNQIAFRIFGLDTSITFAAESGQLQLNAFEPLIYSSIHEAVTLLSASIDMLRTNCVEGLEANAEECSAKLDSSAARATEASETLGYDRAASIAHHALQSGKSWAEALAEMNR
nr:aspartate ammonia-lyase [uncultured Sphingorhabdus sp.]